MARPLRAVLAAAVALSLLAGCEPGEPAEDESSVEALDLVPANAASYAEFALDPTGDQATALDELTRRLPREGREAASDRLRAFFDDSMPPLDVDYADVEAWIGDTAAEYLVTEVIEDFRVLLLEVGDGDAEDPAAVFEEGLTDAADQTYRGIDYVAGKGADGRLYEVGLFEGFVVVSQEGGFAATVDASVSESLATVPEFRQAMQDVEGDALARFYLDLLSMQNEPTLEDQLNREELIDAGVFGDGIVGVTISARGDAVVVESSSGFDKTGLLAPVLRGYRRDEALSELPGHVWFAARVPKVKAVARAITTLGGLKQKPAWRVFRRTLKQAGLRFGRDVLSWTKGATIYVGGRLPFVDAGLLIESKDPRRTGRLVRLLAFLLRRGGMRVTELPSFATDDDFDLHLPGLPQPVHVSGARSFAITYGRPLNQAYREEGFLDASEDFTAALESLGDRYGVTAFVDGDRARSFVEDTVSATGLLPKPYRDEVQPFLAQADYLVHGLAVDGERILQRIVIGVR